MTRTADALDDGGNEPIRWLLVTVSTPGPSSSLRVHVWRKLRSLGALYLQQSVCLLPERPETTRAINRLLDRVNGEGGDGRSLRIVLNDPGEEQAVITQFHAERSDEYHEVCGRTPAFLHEIDSERAKGRTTYAEVEESEADLDRLRTWITRINDRDYFDAPGGSEAADALAKCVESFELFESDALQAEVPVQPEIALATDSRALRIAEDRK